MMMMMMMMMTPGSTVDYISTDCVLMAQAVLARRSLSA